MTYNNESELTNVFPNLAQIGTGVDYAQIRQELDATITEASAINDEAEEDIALDIAACIAECTITNEDCDRCVAGLIDHEINQVNEVNAWFDTRVKNAVDRDISETVGILMSLGVPIQELFPPADASLPPTADDRVRPADIAPTGGDVVPPPAPPALPVLPTATPVTPDSPTTGPPSAPEAPSPLGTANWLPGGDGYICVPGSVGSVPLSAVLRDRADINDALLNGRVDFDGLTRSQLNTGGPFRYILSNGILFATNVETESRPCSDEPTVAPPMPAPPTQPPSGPVNLPEGLRGFCDPNSVEGVLRAVQNQAMAATGYANTDVANFVFNSLGIDTSKQLGITDLIRNPFKSLFAGVMASVGTVAQTLAKVSNAAAYSGTECNSPAFTFTSIVSGVANLFGGWFGLVPQQIRVSNEYALNLQCQYILPSGPEANSLRSRGLLTEAQWRFLVRANGLCEPWQQLILDSLASVPTLDETNRAFKAGYISEETYNEYVRRNGVRSDVDKEVFARLGEFVPGPSDLVRFMVRDSFDQSVVDAGQLDEGFDQKFSGRAREWAAAQGMDEDQFRYFWRSHWSYPSNTQLYEMLHRLRTATPIPGTNLTAEPVTAQDVAEVLRINDVAPAWVDRLMAISYRPLTRVDARRAFELGDLDRQGLLKSYLDLGYAPEDAETLTRFSETSSGPVRAKKLGYASTSEVLGWYRDAVIGRDVAAEKLRQSGVPETNVSRYLDTEDFRRTSRDRRKVISAIQSRYNKGEFSDDQASRQLVDAGVDVSRIPDTIRQWKTLRDSKYKAPTVGMLCKWWAQGIMTIAEYERRLTNLGYSMTDAARIMQTCQHQEEERLKAEAEKFAKQAQMNEEKRLRKEKAAQREAERLAEKLRPCKPPPKPACPATGPALNGQAG